MRSSFFVSVGTLALVSGSVFCGCGDEVTSNDGTGASGGSTGSGGAGGSTFTGTGTGTGMGGAGGTGASGSGGFANTCEEACAYATDCGADLCGLINIDCADPQADCPAQCVLDASCDAIVGTAAGNPDPTLVGCAQACGAGGGGGGNDCATCAGASCFPANCNGSPCLDWIQCVAACGNPACFTACDAQYPGAAAQQTEFYACTCLNCTADCTGITPPCN